MRAAPTNYILLSRMNSAKSAGSVIYQSLLAYGRQIFRLCLGTLILGAKMAERAGLEEKLISNQERFEKICNLLSDEKTNPCDRLEQITVLVDAIERYQFVPAQFKPETMIAAARMAAKVLLACDSKLAEEMTQRLRALVDAKRDDNNLSALEALHDLNKSFPEESKAIDTEYSATVWKLLRVVWMTLFGIYYYLKQ